MSNFLDALDSLGRILQSTGTPPGEDADGEAFGRPCKTRSLAGGVQHRYSFPNGWGASVVRHDGSYGSERGLWELAPLGKDGRLTAWGSVVDDEQVVGYLTEAQVVEWLDKIEAFT